MRREKYHHQANHADEIIMIQVSAFINQFDVGKTYKQSNTGYPVK